MHASQMNEDLKGKVLIKRGKYTLEKTTAGLVLTDGWRSDWIFIYKYNGQWAHDGIFSIRKDIKSYIDKLAYNAWLNNLVYEQS
jgi:hypothetical protein